MTHKCQAIESPTGVVLFSALINNKLDVPAFFFFSLPFFILFLLFIIRDVLFCMSIKIHFKNSLDQLVLTSIRSEMKSNSFRFTFFFENYFVELVKNIWREKKRNYSDARHPLCRQIHQFQLNQS